MTLAEIEKVMVFKNSEPLNVGKCVSVEVSVTVVRQCDLEEQKLNLFILMLLAKGREFLFLIPVLH